MVVNPAKLLKIKKGLLERNTKPLNIGFELNKEVFENIKKSLLS